jgi:YbgC/YbaW family acyl-CoA thioester hydrolase
MDQTMGSQRGTDPAEDTVMSPGAPARPPVDETEAAAVLGRLHAAQNDFYGGGGDAALREVLTPDIAWHVPGHNAIAGDHGGIEAVLAYFAKRRDLAAGTFRLRPRDLLTGHGEWVAALTDGVADVGGREAGWSTVGLYRLRGGKVAECRLLPFDPEVFDAVWSGAGEAATVSAVRVRPRHCDAQSMVHAGRYHEFFEDAFLDWLEERAGGYARLRSGGTDLVIVATGCEHRRPARLGDRLTIETLPERVGTTSLTMSFTIQGPEGEVAVGRITYASVGAEGRAVALPPSLVSAARRDQAAG